MSCSVRKKQGVRRSVSLEGGVVPCELLESDLQKLLRQRWDCWPQRLEIGHTFFEPEVQKALKKHFPRKAKSSDAELALPIKVFFACHYFACNRQSLRPPKYNLRAAYTEAGIATAAVLGGIAKAKSTMEATMPIRCMIAEWEHEPLDMQSNEPVPLVDFAKFFEELANRLPGNKFAEKGYTLDANRLAIELKQEQLRRNAIVAEWQKEIGAFLRLSLKSNDSGVRLSLPWKACSA